MLFSIFDDYESSEVVDLSVPTIENSAFAVLEREREKDVKILRLGITRSFRLSSKLSEHPIRKKKKKKILGRKGKILRTMSRKRQGEKMRKNRTGRHRHTDITGDQHLKGLQKISIKFPD